MALVQEFENSGNQLFKFRGQIPVVIFLIAVLAVLFTNQDFYAEVSHWHYRSFCITVSVIAILVSLSGLLQRSYTLSTTPKGTSGRNTRVQVADSLNTHFTYTLTAYLLLIVMHRHTLACEPLQFWLRPSLWILCTATVLLITIHLVRHHTKILHDDNRD